MPQLGFPMVADGQDSHIELKSDLVYCNHSCDPSLVFDMAKMEVRVADNRPLAIGDYLTFFYPSTGRTMVQPSKCSCAADVCLGTIAGASQISADTLERYWLNEHIQLLISNPPEAG